MARPATRALRHLGAAGEDFSDELTLQVAALRKEIAAIADAVGDYGSPRFNDITNNAVALADEFKHQGAVVAKQVGRQARVATRAVQDNPVPVIVALGAIALISTLIFARD